MSDDIVKLRGERGDGLGADRLDELAGMFRLTIGALDEDEHENLRNCFWMAYKKVFDEMGLKSSPEDVSVEWDYYNQVYSIKCRFVNAPRGCSCPSPPSPEWLGNIETMIRLTLKEEKKIMEKEKNERWSL